MFWREVPRAHLDPDRILHEFEDDRRVRGWAGGSFEASFTLRDEQTVTLGTLYGGQAFVVNPPTPERSNAVSALRCRLHDLYEKSQPG